jgi:hypothetical protein
LPSLHAVPFVTGVVRQPSAASHESVVHGLPSLQTSAVPAAQEPAWQVSAPLHASPSLQAVPFATGAVRQPSAASQESVVHGLPSLQTSAVPAAQEPAWHVSAPLHALPSLHAVPFATGAVTQPVAASQESVVHGLPSLQTSAVPCEQKPDWQVSAPLHALPSLQAVPLGTGVVRHPMTG